MRHRAVHGNVVAQPREQRRRAAESRQVAGPRGQHRRLRAMRAPHAEVDQQPAMRDERDACGLAGNQRRVMEQVHHAALDELRLAKRRRDPQDRFVGEKHRAFRHRVDRARKAEAGERREEIGAQAPGRCQSLKGGGRKAQARQIVEDGRQSRRHQECPMLGQRPYEELEAGHVVHSGIERGLHHRQFIPIRQQHVVDVSVRPGSVHHAPSRAARAHSCSLWPAAAIRTSVASVIAARGPGSTEPRSTRHCTTRHTDSIRAGRCSSTTRAQAAAAPASVAAAERRSRAECRSDTDTSVQDRCTSSRRRPTTTRSARRASPEPIDHAAIAYAPSARNGESPGRGNPGRGNRGGAHGAHAAHVRAASARSMRPRTRRASGMRVRACSWSSFFAEMRSIVLRPRRAALTGINACPRPGGTPATRHSQASGHAVVAGSHAAWMTVNNAVRQYVNVSDFFISTHVIPLRSPSSAASRSVANTR
ncbi:hypothetical protein BDI4_1200052 [Burkholderia diffusa]|nr:hypothetical protein BDI4_1200052 [Burkholderia diffusa]